MNKIICDTCKKEISPSMQSLKSGDLEYTFFTCGSCGMLYVVSVTDSALRESIRRYKKIIKGINRGVAASQMQRYAHNKLEENAQRSKELRVNNPLTLGIIRGAGKD